MRVSQSSITAFFASGGEFVGLKPKMKNRQARIAVAALDHRSPATAPHAFSHGKESVFLDERELREAMHWNDPTRRAARESSLDKAERDGRHQGLIATLTDEQIQAVREYDGPEGCGGEVMTEKWPTTRERLARGEVHPIQKLRTDMGLTQPEMAEIFGFSQATVSRWESGVVDPDVATLQLAIRIARAHGCRFDYAWFFEPSCWC